MANNGDKDTCRVAAKADWFPLDRVALMLGRTAKTQVTDH